MKKTIYLRSAILMASLALTISSFGQYSGLTMNVSRNSSKVTENSADVRTDAKEAALEQLKQMNLKVYLDFKKSAKHANDIRVSQTSKNIFVVYDYDDVHHRICYDPKGNRSYHIQYYGLEKIPADVLQLVQNEYPFYTVLRGSEIEANGKTAFLVDIDGKRSFKTIRVVDGEFDIYSSHNK